MFERRLRYFFLILLIFSLLLVMRAAQLQVWGADHWRRKALAARTRPTYLQTTRGSILDSKGVLLAVDEPCIDVVVEFPALQEDATWIRDIALRRLLKLPDEQYRRLDRSQRVAMLTEAQEQVRRDLAEMWKTLARETRTPLEEIEQIKAEVRRKVTMRQRHVWYARYANALDRHEEREREAWYTRWLSGEAEPQLDSFWIEVTEQTEKHIIIRDVAPEAHNAIKKRIEEMPGLDLRPGLRRHYPLGSSASHVVGMMSSVLAEDLRSDPNADDDLREYGANDRIGRNGVEALAERSLRGVRGKILRVDGVEQEDESSAAEPGKDVRITLDMRLQRDIEEAFKLVEFRSNGTLIDAAEMYGAAVVIDIASGELRAMVSHPRFDLNELDKEYTALNADKLNRPMLNRATQMALVPGSTVKPIVALGAMTDGLLGVGETIECRGHLYIDGVMQDFGKCWTVNVALAAGGNPMHHQIPDQDKHPTGHLNLADALQRSCNVYFETVGIRMGIEGLSKWYNRFGLGQRTEIGITEAKGWVPTDLKIPAGQRRSAAWINSIGQGQVAATPLQMANVAATLARNGVWVRPRLLTDPKQGRATSRARPDREDLRISPAGLALARQGMVKVTSTTAGTGHQVYMDYLVVAGKTGSAQTKGLSRVMVDDEGEPRIGKDGRVMKEDYRVSVPGRPNHDMRWYRASNPEGRLSHAWFIGYAPAQNPTVAFAVMMEYGGGGGEAAPIVRALLEACMAYGYIPRPAGG